LGFDAGDSNLYRYVNNNPANATDPSGQVAMIEWSVLQRGIITGGLTGAIFGLLVGAAHKAIDKPIGKWHGSD
jgi:hypothetical protein